MGVCRDVAISGLAAAAGYTQQLVSASECWLCGATDWYYLGGLPTEQRLSWQLANETNLAPPPGGAFSARPPALCNRFCGAMQPFLW